MDHDDYGDDDEDEDGDGNGPTHPGETEEEVGALALSCRPAAYVSLGQQDELRDKTLSKGTKKYL